MQTILFICWGNSCRSIIAEALMRSKAPERFTAISAGVEPAGAVNPNTLALLRERGLSTEGLHSKSWHSLAGQQFDVVLTLCSKVARLPKPDWRGSPILAHWGMADPFAVTESQDAIRAAYAETWRLLDTRITAALDRLGDDLDQATVAAELGRIGTLED